MKTILLDKKAKPYLETEKRIYEKMKKNGASERDIVAEFVLENEVVFHDTTSEQRFHAKRALQENNGHETYFNAMLIYDIVTGLFNVEYK